MISLLVRGVSGHWGIPGMVPQGGTSASFQVPPPSTVRGFLESLSGARRGDFEGSIGWGWSQRPKGHGQILRRSSVWASSGGKKRDSLGRPNSETLRTVFVETWYDYEVVVLVEGKWESRILQGVRGEIHRNGVLCLGESDDLVQVLQIDTPPKNVEWVVKGTELVLPIESRQGYGTLSPVYGRFDVRIGEPEMHSFTRTEKTTKARKKTGARAR